MVHTIEDFRKSGLEHLALSFRDVRLFKDETPDLLACRGAGRCRGEGRRRGRARRPSGQQGKRGPATLTLREEGGRFRIIGVVRRGALSA